MSRSTGFSTGSSQVRSRVKTRVMKRPSGAVTARIASRKTRIWNHPLRVMTALSEFFRLQERVRQIHEQCDGHDEAHDVIDGHRSLPRRSHPITYEMASAKNSAVSKRYVASMCTYCRIVPSNVTITLSTNMF